MDCSTHATATYPGHQQNEQRDATQRHRLSKVRYEVKDLAETREHDNNAFLPVRSESANKRLVVDDVDCQMNAKPPEIR